MTDTTTDTDDHVAAIGRYEFQHRHSLRRCDGCGKRDGSDLRHRGGFGRGPMLTLCPDCW